MSHIISNPYVEEDMTNKFVCVIYYKERNDVAVLSQGISPSKVWDVLGYNAYNKDVVPIILDKLIHNNILRRLISFNRSTKKVSLTSKGRRWAENNCGKYAGVI
jgi:hypothetical protein